VTTASEQYATHQCTCLTTCVQSDSADLSKVASLVRFDAAGTVKVEAELGDAYTATVIAGETWTGVRIKKIWDTGTSLTNAQIMLGSHQ
jgi:hypothetical protein